MVRYFARTGKMEIVHKILAGRFEGRRRSRRPRRRCEASIKMRLNEKGTWAISGFSWLRIGSNCFILYKEN
jgi:hypothetical protein